MIFENVIKKSFHSILFDSKKNKNFDSILYMKNVLFYIETENNQKFGCFISSPITIKNEYISDSYCFLFKINENNQLLLFPNY